MFRFCLDAAVFTCWGEFLPSGHETRAHGGETKGGNRVLKPWPIVQDSHRCRRFTLLGEVSSQRASNKGTWRRNEKWKPGFTALVGCKQRASNEGSRRQKKGWKSDFTALGKVIRLRLSATVSWSWTSVWASSGRSSPSNATERRKRDGHFRVGPRS